ncbi:MAG TPA: thiamine diphosphokinase [Candidatus Kapabacteria bacterium]|jgi:thiamine pyrophosphokinase|nr:thiamine diphosphokinase [Candidatus Kapabacteria bacterium]HRK59138.1 thiamine diphosphokinase [Candidatus Kapabacteria bacterium]
MRLEFYNAPFDCIICLNGEMPDPHILAALHPAPFIAADGASKQLQMRGFTPSVIIGDMDSIEVYTSFPQSQIVYIPEQDTNDFEKALRFCVANSFHNILICGFHGGELDHTLNNWSVFMKFCPILSLTILDGKRYAIPLLQSVSFSTIKNELISLIPQPSCKVTLQGFVWNLVNDVLSMGLKEGARNRAAETMCSIDIHDGQVLCFLSHRFPFVPTFVS